MPKHTHTNTHTNTDTLCINIRSTSVLTLVLTVVYVTGPGKTGLMYTKYTCLYYGTYLLFCICYRKSVNVIEFLSDFCIYDDILHAIRITDKSYYISNSQNQVKFYM